MCRHLWILSDLLVKSFSFTVVHVCITHHFPRIFDKNFKPLLVIGVCLKSSERSDV